MCMQTVDEKITQWVECNRNAVLEDWMSLVRIPSLQAAAEPGAPYGKACAEVLEKAAEIFERRGFTTRIDTQSGYMLARSAEAEKTIGLFGHGDVVPVGDGWLFTEPFAPVIKDGCMIGRGASDNKSGIMASLCAMSILKECAIPMHSAIQAFVGSNEETGMLDIQAFAAKERMPEVSLVPDGGFPCVMGEKGIVSMWAAYSTPLEDICDFSGGDAFNVVLDKVEITLKASSVLEAQLREKVPSDPDFALTVRPDGSIFLCVRGVAKHAAAPEGSVNAAVKAAKVLADCDALAAADRSAMASVAALLEPYYGETLGIAHEDSCFGKLTAANGMFKVEDGKLHASLNIRYGVELQPEELEENLQKGWNDQGWQITWLSNEPGYKAAEGSPVPGIMEEEYNRVTGFGAKPYLMSGGTYARHLKNAFPVGVSAACAYQELPAFRMPEGHGGAHQRDECINIDDFFRGVRILTHALLRLDAWLRETDEI